MISSIPLIAPRDAHNLWYTPSRSFALTPPATSPSNLGQLGASQNFNPTELNNSRTLNQNQPKRPQVISPLTQLALDEQSVEQRKLNIQRFGATWIRPPGLSKTLQGELDEKAERAEAARLAMLEEGGADDVMIDNEVDGEDVEGAMGHNMQQEQEEEGEDLDADIPEAESFEGEDEGTEDEEVDLDAGIPEAEADWDESNESGSDSGNSENAEESDEEISQLTPGVRYANRPTIPPSSSLGMRTDSSPQQMMFSHDDRFGPQDPARVDMREYSRRYQAASVISEDDEMEVDSD